ncbi:MAG: histidine--tRNA ligase [Planctomycetota bacterium]|nr:MAG: histidine--tRNA ligase [Planctomycetota bacterium]
MSQRIDTQPVKGTRDVYPDDMRVRQWLFAHWRKVAAQFGFEEYDACVLESESLYVRKAGDEITGQLYNFTDKGGRQVALRPEMTPTLARMVMARGAQLAMPLRWNTIAQCFRYERMQRGRKREHFQWNMDIVGLASVAAEAELMAAQAAFLQAVGLPSAGIVFKVSHRGILQHYLQQLGIDDQRFSAVCVVIDKHDKIGPEATVQLLAEHGVDAATAQSILELMAVRGLEQLRDVVAADNPGLNDLEQLMTLAAAYGIAESITIDCSVVRGLSYYTGTVWELFDASGSVPRAVAGGGRYDGLLEHLGGTPAPMVGFGFGDVVILDVLSEHGLLPALDKGIDDVVFPLRAEVFPQAAALAQQLRGQGRHVVVDYSERRFKHIIARAEQDGAEHLYVIGPDEAARGVAKKRVVGQREESEIALPNGGTVSQE